MRAAAYSRAVNYARVSTVMQSGDNHWSLPVQQQKFREICAANRWEPVGEFVDVDSGRRDARREYQRLLTAARAGEFDVIVVQFLDRFGRNPREILRRYWELDELGVSVVVTDEDVQEELMLLIRAAMAGKESERISQRVIPTMEAVVLAGRWPGGAPYGYTLIQDRADSERGHLVINETEAKVVRRIFDLYLVGRIGWSKIAGRLNDEGVRAPRGGFWWASTVQFILGNLCYVGRLRWRGHEARCPPIVSEETFEAAQDLIERRKLSTVRIGPESGFLLQGLVRCACGTFRHCWTAHRSQRPGRTGRHLGYIHPPHRYYRCAHGAQAKTCRVGLVDAEKLEQWLLDKFRGWTIPEEIRSAPTDPARHAATLRQRENVQAKIERYRQRLSRSYDARMDGEISKAEYQAKRAEYLAAIAEAEQELAQLQTGPTPIDLSVAIAQVRQFAADIAALSVDDLRAELVEMIEYVEIVDRHTWRIVPREDFAPLLVTLLT